MDREHVLTGLKNFLWFFNAAVLCVCVGNAANSPRANAQSMYHDSISIWIASHACDGLLWFLIASALFSFGLYSLVSWASLPPGTKGD